jgi:hypothetical protein
MEIENRCGGHGQTRAGLIGRGAETVAGGVPAASGGSPGVAEASAADHRRVPRAGAVPDTRLARAVANFTVSSYPPFLADHCQRSFQLAVLIAAAGSVRVDLEVLHAGVLILLRRPRGWRWLDCWPGSSAA